MAKKKIELKPTIEDNTVMEIPQNKGETMTYRDDDIIETSPKSDADSFFRNAVNMLYDTKKDVSAKTEYLNVMENFAGAKLEFLADFCKMPYLRNFLEAWEIKRISLERKGRKEILLALEKRQEELNAQQSRMFSAFNGQFGLR